MNPNVKILIDALQNIQTYDHDGNGICPYGCDTPYIAKKALVDFGNAEYAPQPAVEGVRAKSGPKWWCCNADYGKHEPTCPNYKPPAA